MQGVFHLNSTPRTDPSHGRKTSNTWCASSGSSTVFPSASFDILDDVSHLCTSWPVGERTEGLKEHTLEVTIKLYQQPPASPKVRKRKIKQEVGPQQGVISFTGVTPTLTKNLITPLRPPPSTKPSHVKATEHLWFRTKTFHLLSQLTFCTLATLHNQTFQTKSSAAAPSSICSLIQASHFHTFVSFWP